MFLAHLPVLALNNQMAEKDGQSGAWKYKLISTKSGPVSVGKLTYKDKKVVGHEYDRIVTGVGTFMWRPERCDKDPCGWRRINPGKKYSRWRMVVIDESETGAVWHPVPVKFP